MDDSDRGRFEESFVGLPFIHHRDHMNWPGIKPGSLWQGPTTNCLNHEVATAKLHRVCIYVYIFGGRRNVVDLLYPFVSEVLHLK